MNRFNWTYIDHKNERHHVGLMHGAQSGNLLVYCNTDILIIDFQVLRSHTYSFFIEEELCELSIEKTADQQYLYSFDLNTKADTPLNRYRKKLSKKHLWQSLAFLGGFLILVLSLTLSFTYWNKYNTQQQFAYGNGSQGRETVAQISIEPESEGRLVSYYFVANGKSYTADTKFKENATPFFKHGMPLLAGDEFVVKYAIDDPSINEIDYNRPSLKQISTYRTRAIQQHLEFHPELDLEYCTCVAKIAFKMKGINGLADLYFQRVPEEENPKHNINSYKRLVRSPKFTQRVEEKCWGQ